MRISDWSSDVCSSDLTLSRRHCGCAFTKARNSALVTGRLCSSNGATSTLRTSSYLSAERKLPPGSCTQLLPAAASAATGRATSSSAGPRRMAQCPAMPPAPIRSEEHTSELQSLMRISYAVFCLKNTKQEWRKNQVIHQKHRLRQNERKE